MIAPPSQVTDPPEPVERRNILAARFKDANA